MKIPESMKMPILTFINEDEKLNRPEYFFPALKAMRLTNLVFCQAPKELTIEPKQEINQSH